MPFFFLRYLCSRNPIIRALINRIANYPDIQGKFVENYTKPIALKLPVIRSSAVQCYGIEFQNKRGRKV